MNYDLLVPGRVVCIPLLGGGYAFAIVSFFDKGIGVLCNVLDTVGSKTSPPDEIGDLDVLIYDLYASSEFGLTKKANAGKKWRITKSLTGHHSSVRNCYYRMGTETRGYYVIDISGKTPDRDVTKDEALTFPSLGHNLPPFTTAEVEVAVKHLTISPDVLIDRWVAGELSNQ